MNIFVDSRMNDDRRRSELYQGAVFVHSPSENALRLCRLAQEMIEEAFSPNDPLRIHEHISAEKCAEILGVLKPKFIHHPKSKEYIQGMLDEAVCDPEKTYGRCTNMVPELRIKFPAVFVSL